MKYDKTCKRIWSDIYYITVSLSISNLQSQTQFRKNDCGLTVELECVTFILNS